MCWDSWFGIMPLYGAAILSFFAPALIDCADDSRHHYLHFSTKIDDNWPILMEIRPGEVAEVLARRHMPWFDEVEVR